MRKSIIVCAMLFFTASSAYAQLGLPRELNDDKLLADAAGDIGKIDYEEAKLLADIFVDCNSLVSDSAPRSRECKRAYARYAIEYQQDRQLDKILKLMQRANRIFELMGRTSQKVDAKDIERSVAVENRLESVLNLQFDRLRYERKK